jgi:hypothetical protein
MISEKISYHPCSFFTCHQIRTFQRLHFAVTTPHVTDVSEPPGSCREEAQGCFSDLRFSPRLSFVHAGRGQNMAVAHDGGLAYNHAVGKAQNVLAISR